MLKQINNCLGELISILMILQGEGPVRACIDKTSFTGRIMMQDTIFFT